MDSQPVTIMQRLREATRQAHLDVEASMRLTSLDDLHEIVVAFFGFHRTWESLAAAVLQGDAVAFDDRRKLPLLEADLRDFGYDAEAMRRLPACADLPAIRDPDEALGSMYVMEGSTLGGQLIARFARDELHLPDGRCTHYFRSYGNDVGVMWRRFGERINAAGLPDSPSADRMVSAALSTFRLVGQWMATVRATRMHIPSTAVEHLLRDAS